MYKCAVIPPVSSAFCFTRHCHGFGAYLTDAPRSGKLNTVTEPV
ncbi:hypothetical protein [Methanooceanicella nereidis]|nr:hypothetical protein [Methanocella sp. CWC-04]